MILSRADRRLARFVVSSTVVGIVSLGVGVWILTHPLPPQDDPLAYSGSWVAALLMGALGVGLPWIEVRRRRRRGSGEPGRHTRS